MEIKEKLCAVVSNNGNTYFLYGPDIRNLKCDASNTSGLCCYMLSKPVEQADEKDIIECVGPVDVWFSNFQIYKHILRKMYGQTVFNSLSQKRWDFLSANRNRFQLLYVKVGDYGCISDEFKVVCFDSLKGEYISLEIDGANHCFNIHRIQTEDKEIEKILKTSKEDLKLIENNSFKTTPNGVEYKLLCEEYEPLFLLYKFIKSFYFYFVTDGNLITYFDPLKIKQ